MFELVLSISIIIIIVCICIYYFITNDKTKSLYEIAIEQKWQKGDNIIVKNNAGYDCECILVAYSKETIVCKGCTDGEERIRKWEHFVSNNSHLKRIEKEEIRKTKEKFDLDQEIYNIQ